MPILGFSQKDTPHSKNFRNFLKLESLRRKCQHVREEDRDQTTSIVFNLSRSLT